MFAPDGTLRHGDTLDASGAATAREESYGEHLGHVVRLDPDGNEFCVA
jgi:hypothetical protein